MTEPEGLFTRRLMLGRELRRLRGDRTLKAVAAFTGLSDSSISRIERGKQKILPSNVRLLCQCYGIGAPQVDMLVRQAEESEDRRSLVLDSDSIADWSESFFDLLLAAEEIWTFEDALAPGMVQPAAYTKAVVDAGESGNVTADGQIEVRGSLRQRLLNGGWQYRVVLDEAIFRRVVGSREVMVDLCDELVELSGLPNVEIQVLRFEAGAHIAMTGPFTMLRFADELDMNRVFVELDHAVWSAEKPQDNDRYNFMFQRLREQALSGEKSRDWLVSLAEYYRASGGRSG